MAKISVTYKQNKHLQIRILHKLKQERRAMAVASEQEMKARVQEMRAKVVEAESEVPLAMAEALREGNLGVKDYYNLKRRGHWHEKCDKQTY